MRPFFRIPSLLPATILLAGCGTMVSGGVPDTARLDRMETEVAELRREVAILRPTVDSLARLEPLMRSYLVAAPQVMEPAAPKPAPTAAAAASAPRPVTPAPAAPRGPEPERPASAAPKPAKPVAETKPRAQMVALTPTPAPAPVPAPEPDGEFGVHLASYKHQSQILPGWEQLRARFPVLKPLSPVVSPVDFHDGRGTFFRLKAGPLGAAASAETVCKVLKQAGAYCQVDVFDGAPARQTAER